MDNKEQQLMMRLIRAVEKMEDKIEVIAKALSKPPYPDDGKKLESDFGTYENGVVRLKSGNKEQ